MRRWHLWRLVKEGFAAFMDDHALTRGAAISFYAVTAIAPVLFIATAIAGAGLGQAAASQAVRQQLRQVMSPQGADLVQLAIIHVNGDSHTVLGSIIGLITLVVIASGVFTEMEDSLNVIWKAPRNESFFYELMRGRLVSLGMVVILGFILMLSMVFAGGVGVAVRILGEHTALSRVFVGVADWGFSFVLITALFAAMYKILPNTPLLWRDVFLGAAGTAMLFQVGQYVIGLYLTRLVTANIYGAAGAVMVLLIWVYYSAQIFLLGAEFTKVWTIHYGSKREN